MSTLVQALLALEPAALEAVKALIADLEAKRDPSASVLLLERHVEAAAARAALGLPPRA